jgi:hypothetical protein
LREEHNLFDLLKLLYLSPFFFSSSQTQKLHSNMSNLAATRERRPSTSAPISDLQGPVGPGFTRPKHKRTFTGFGAGEIKSVEGE